MNAERVRSAQLASLRDVDEAITMPTNIDDDENRRRRRNLAAAIDGWATIPVDEIIAFYSLR